MCPKCEWHRGAGKPGKQRGSPRPAGGAGEDESSEEEEEPFTQAATQPTPQVAPNPSICLSGFMELT